MFQNKKDKNKSIKKKGPVKIFENSKTNVLNQQIDWPSISHNIMAPYQLTTMHIERNTSNLFRTKKLETTKNSAISTTNCTMFKTKIMQTIFQLLLKSDEF